MSKGQINKFTLISIYQLIKIWPTLIIIISITIEKHEWIPEKENNLNQCFGILLLINFHLQLNFSNFE